MRSTTSIPHRVLWAASAAAAVCSPLALAQSEPAAPAVNPDTPSAASGATEPPKSGIYLSAGPDSATLPTGVFRLKAGPIEGFGKKGRDAEGKEVDYGISADGWGLGFSLAYGITDTLSMEISSGYALTNKLGIDKAQFRKSSLYKDNYDVFVKSAATALAADKSLCATVADCVAFIEGNGSLPVDQDMPLPTGETLKVKRNVPLKAYADSIVLNGAKGSEGKTGLQDIDVGVLWNALKHDDYGFAVGGGVRIPTGSFKEVASGYRATGRGTFDLGLKLIGDYKIIDGLWVGAQNQMEWNLVKGKRKKTSLLDNTRTLSKEEDFERWGTRHKGQTRIAWGAGTLDQSLNWLGVTLLPVKWEFNSIDVVDGQKVGDPAEFTETEMGFTLDGFPMGVPLQLYTYYVLPTWGRNQAASLSWAGTTLSAFYKF